MNEGLQEALLETQKEIPFNNFSRVLREAGESVPGALGGGCIVQAGHLSEKLKDRGFDPKCLKAVQATHFAVVCSTRAGLHYMDPFLLQREPSLLPTDYRAGYKNEVDARPVVSGHPTKVVLEGLRGGYFTVETTGYKEEHGVYTSTWNAFFDPKKATEGLPSAEEAPSSFPTQLVLRVPEEGGGVLNIRKKVGSERGAFLTGRVGHKNLRVDQGRIGEEEGRCLETIAQLVNVEVMEILAKMEAAAEICLREMSG